MLNVNAWPNRVSVAGIRMIETHRMRDLGERTTVRLVDSTADPALAPTMRVAHSRSAPRNPTPSRGVMAASGVPVGLAQRIMRHRDVRLTMESYLDEGLLPLSAAMASLPRMRAVSA